MTESKTDLRLTCLRMAREDLAEAQGGRVDPTLACERAALYFEFVTGRPDDPRTDQKNGD